MNHTKNKIKSMTSHMVTTNRKRYTKGEGVGTSNFRTTTGHFFQNVEIVFLVYHYYDKKRLLMFLFYLWRQKRSQRRKSKYQLPIAYYLWLSRPVGG
jgi:hypothetical protein